ncbi:MAG TPA: cytochrome c oxidase subunit 3 family protein [Planctomycetaceae bacterium]|nr:cytochrome c oxidase subunit 3 family protein [Planctomycetaceae bacterium]
MSDAAVLPAHHFETHEQQRLAGEVGMWLFLVTEFMFFGGLFLAYFIYRNWYPVEFVEGGHTMDSVLGAINTGVLLTSSLTMALAVHAAEQSERRRTLWLLIATMVFGTIFLGVKAYEYHHKYEEGLMPFLAPEVWQPDRRGLATFLHLYFLMTGVHAFHMVIGIGALAILARWTTQGVTLGPRSLVVHNVGLYWHFVDLVWVFLFPFFYLVA